MTINKLILHHKLTTSLMSLMASLPTDPHVVRATDGHKVKLPKIARTSTERKSKESTQEKIRTMQDIQTTIGMKVEPVQRGRCFLSFEIGIY